MYWYSGQVAIQLLSVWVLGLLVVGKLSFPPAFKAAWLPISLLSIFLLFQWLLNLEVVSVFESADRSATRSQLLKTFCLLQLFCLMLMLITEQRYFKWLVTALLISGTFQAVYGTLMTVTGTDYIWNYEKEAYRGVATGTFINRNHLAGYLEMTIALGLGLMIASLSEGRSRTWRQFFRGLTETLLGEKARIRICLVLMVIGLILTRSRMGNTAFFVGMGVAGVIGLFLFRRSQPGIVLLFVSILIIDILLLGTFFGVEELQERLQNTSLEKELRPSTISLSFGLLQAAPWVGHGLGTFYAVFPQVRDGDYASLTLHTHADVLQFPIELGLVGFAPLLIFYLYSLYTAIQVQRKRHNRFYRAMGFSATMALVAIGLHSFADFNLQIFANAATFVCILAMPFLCANLSSQRRRSSKMPESGSGAG